MYIFNFCAMQISTLTYQQSVIQGNITDQQFIIYRPVTTGGYFGDLICLDQSDLDNQKHIVTIDLVENQNYCKPIGFTPVFDFSEFKSNSKVTFYKAIPQKGYVGIGLVTAQTKEDLPKNFLCVSEKLINWDQENTSINIFNPFGKYTTLVTNYQKCFNIDEKVPSFNEKVYIEIEKAQQLLNIDSILSLITQIDGEQFQLPLLDITQKKDFLDVIIPQDDENDNMRDMKCVQQENGFGLQLANQKLLTFQESEFFTPAISYNLLGITSATPPAQSSQEDYLYLLEPIAPPGYKTLSLVLSKSIYPEQEYMTIHEMLTVQTSQSELIGKIYDIETASYIYDYVQIEIDSSMDMLEKTRKYKELGQINLKTISLITPRQSCGAILASNELSYPVMHPLIQSMLNINNSVSQKSLIKGLKQEPSFQYYTSVDFINHSFSFFTPLIKKETYQQIFTVYSSRKASSFDFSKQLVSKPIESRAKTPVRQAESSVNLNVQSSQDVPEDIPIDWSIISNSHGFANNAICEPEDFIIVWQSGKAESRVQLIKLIAPIGYVALSDVVHKGAQNFDKSKFACINQSFTNNIRVQKLCQLNENWSIVEPVLPYGTQACQSSSLKLLYIISSQASFADQFVYILKDNVFQAHATQEQCNSKLIYPGKNAKLDKKIIEQKVLFKNILELQVQTNNLFKKYSITNVEDEQYSYFSSFISNIQLHSEIQEGIQDSEQIQNIQDQEVVESMQQILVTTNFGKKFSTNGIFAKAQSIQLLGQILDEETKLFCYRIIPFDDYVSLGFLITQKENPLLGNIITIHKEFVQYLDVQPQYQISGYFQTSGLWIYIHDTQLFIFDYPHNNIKIPVISQSLLQFINSKQSKSSIYLADEMYTITNPTPLYNYLTSFSHNNKISLSQLHIYDFGINAFDQLIVNDPICKNSLLLSVSSLRFLTSSQKLSSEFIKNSTKPEQFANSKKPGAAVYLKKAQLIKQLLQILRSLNFNLDFIYFGKKPQLAFKINEKYIVISDKVPIYSSGGFLMGEDAQISDCLAEKVFAKICGSYDKLYALDNFQLINFILQIYGFSESYQNHVFDLYFVGDEIIVDYQEGAVKLSFNIK